MDCVPLTYSRLQACGNSRLCAAGGLTRGHAEHCHRPAFWKSIKQVNKCLVSSACSMNCSMKCSRWSLRIVVYSLYKGCPTAMAYPTPCRIQSNALFGLAVKSLEPTQAGALALLEKAVGMSLSMSANIMNFPLLPLSSSIQCDAYRNRSAGHPA